MLDHCAWTAFPPRIAFHLDPAAVRQPYGQAISGRVAKIGSARSPRTGFADELDVVLGGWC